MNGLKPHANLFLFPDEHFMRFRHFLKSFSLRNFKLWSKSCYRLRQILCSLHLYWNFFTGSLNLVFMLFRNDTPWILALVSLSTATVIASPQMLLTTVFQFQLQYQTVGKKIHYIAKTHTATVTGIQDC